jgi:hypothetical protein
VQELRDGDRDRLVSPAAAWKVPSFSFVLAAKPPKRKKETSISICDSMKNCLHSFEFAA